MFTILEFEAPAGKARKGRSAMKEVNTISFRTVVLKSSIPVAVVIWGAL